MANPSVKVNIDFSETLTAAAVRVQRQVTGLGLGVELASQIDPQQVQAMVDGFLPPPTDSLEDLENEISMLREARGNIEREVARDLAWLIAAAEHLAALEALRDHRKTSCPTDCDYDPAVDGQHRHKEA